MIRYIFLIALLTGCATAPDSPESSSYFLVSQGGASLIYKALMGGVDYCKITQNNLGATDFDVVVSWDGKNCAVEAQSSDNNE